MKEPPASEYHPEGGTPPAHDDRRTRKAPGRPNGAGAAVAASSAARSAPPAPEWAPTARECISCFRSGVSKKRCAVR
eukprot:13181791-Alexandrium_andersonii.AAC.1